MTFFKLTNIALFCCSFLMVKGQKINFNYNNHCINNLIYFEDVSNLGIDEPVSWFWEFGDQGVSNDQSPVYAYANPGKYTVKLTINTITNQTYSIAKKIEIKSSPFAFFNPKNMCDKTVLFEDNTVSPNTNIKMWMWDFGDGGFSMNQHPKYKFNDGKNPKVRLQVRDEYGCWDSISQTINTVQNPQTGFDINNVILSNPTIIRISSKNKKDSVFYLINEQAVNNNQYITAPTNEKSVIKQKVINEYGCADSSEIEVHPNNDYYLALPSYFSPSKTSGNTTFGLFDDRIKVEEFIITDAMGNAVYKTTNTKGWNGQVNNKGVIPPKGIYIYYINFKNENNTTVTQKGKFVFSP